GAQVALLPRIPSEIEELPGRVVLFARIPDDLPVALADPAMAVKLPSDVIVRSVNGLGLAAEDRQQRRAERTRDRISAVRVAGVFGACELEERRQQVEDGAESIRTRA